ncbi:MAG: D-glycerate dehydrogenase [Halieaceae bacterium]|jgi:glyoxylate reductase|nr:D-glycerate dehydrogenase [Halieaceae bacterium]
MSGKIVVTLPLPEAALTPLRERFEVEVWEQSAATNPDMLFARLADAQGVLCSLGTQLSAETISQLPGLKVISSISVGVDHIDLAAATTMGIPVGHTPGVLVDSTADLALALMLAATRRIGEADRFVREGRWQTGWDTGFFLGTDLSRATVGLVGMGPIGQAVAKRLAGFGARVIAWNRTRREVPGLEWVEWVELDDLFARADIVSLHTALNDDTAGLISAERLAAMRNGSVLINTARGGLVDEAALVAELQNGRLRAGLDVYTVEPLPTDSPLLGLDNVILVPHLGSATAATRQAMLERALSNLIAGMTGARVPYCANPEVFNR